MKLVSKKLEKNSSGFVKLIAEDTEDLWHTYNLLFKDDILKATTVRRVVSETNTGSTEKLSQKTTLTIKVETVFFDVQASVLRVNGKNIEENKYVKMGQYHTLDLELHRPFTIEKEEWDIIHLDRINDCCNVQNKADIGAVVLQEGLAQICLVTENMTIVRQRIETNVPKKRRGTTTDHDKGVIRFFHQVYQGIIHHINFDIVKVLIIASPALKEQQKVILDHRDKIILVHSSSGHKHALQEILQEPQVQSKLSDTKYQKEIKALEEFYRTLGNDPSKAFYGYEYVLKASERGAIQTLMVTDGLFSLHTSGEQLTQLTGIAAILHFGLPDLEDEVAQEQEEKEKLFKLREGDELIQEDPTDSLGY
ncbi:hypothetical protein HK103_005939 [Boothiomyces macroporosus]|uniref:Protein DOM34 homolog n=1 Tax=Boothiomyces macroporosus TaxID=261099 RepID=A0AAD5ULP4_9FUNG|nr:hypothetical protein HK103_005939 [Boothiomyces macroporosus]